MKGILAKKASFRLSNVDMVAGTAIILLSTFLLAYAVPYDIDLGFGTKSGITPRTMPYAVAVGMLLCGVKILYDGYRKKQLAAMAKAKKGQEEKTVPFFALSFSIFLMGLVFSGLLNLVGYPVANIALMMFLYYISGGTKLTTALLLGALFSAASVLFFSYYLKLSIPFGFWM